MRVLVTGATGFVGSHAAARLHASGHQVRVLARDRRKAERVLQERGLGDCDLVVGDAADETVARAALRGCDAVVHTAAAPFVGLASGQSPDSIALAGVRAVLGGACSEGVAAALYVSSVLAIFHPDPRRVTGDAPLARRRGRKAERYVRSLQQSGAPVKTLYAGRIVGPDDPGLSSGMRDLRRWVEEGIHITSGGAQHVDVRDLVDAAALLVEGVRGPGRHLLPGHFLTWGELADLLDRLCGRPLHRERVAGWRLRARGRLADWMRPLRESDASLSAEATRHATRWPRIENSPELARRGLALRSPAETFRDTLAWMCRARHLEQALAPGLAIRRGPQPG